MIRPTEASQEQIWHAQQTAWFIRALHEYVAAQKLPQGLEQAIFYAINSPGKRLRPMLLLAVGDFFGVERENLRGLALSMELLHTYSLVHDDLPAMDNDTYRRNLPTVHIAYDQATAVLVGDALQSMAFGAIIDDQSLSESQKIRCLRTLYSSGGAQGMVAGQFLDWQRQCQAALTPAERSAIHPLKTGLCLQNAFVLALDIHPDLADRNHWAEIGALIGLAYQYLDDHFDDEPDSLLDNSDLPVGVSGPKHFPTYRAKCFWILEYAQESLLNLGVPRSHLLFSLLAQMFPVESVSEIISTEQKL